MSFETLLAKVTRAEDALEANERQVAANARVFGTSWRQVWSPSRLLAAGLATGFLAGWVRPARAVAGVQPVRWLQLLGSVAGLAGSVQAAFAAASAQEAVDEAEGVAAAAGTAGVAAAAAGPAGAAVASAARQAAAGAAAAAAPTPEVRAAPQPRVAPQPRAAPVAPAPPSARRYAPDPSWDTPPRPAEAATELSEPR